MNNTYTLVGVIITILPVLLVGLIIVALIKYFVQKISWSVLDDIIYNDITDAAFNRVNAQN